MPVGRKSEAKSRADEQEAAEAERTRDEGATQSEVLTWPHERAT